MKLSSLILIKIKNVNIYKHLEVCVAQSKHHIVLAIVIVIGK